MSTVKTAGLEMLLRGRRAPTAAVVMGISLLYDVSLGVTGKSSGLFNSEGKSKRGSEPCRVKAVAFLKLIGSNLDGSGAGPENGSI